MIRFIMYFAAAILLSACGRIEAIWSSAKSYTGNIDRTVTMVNCSGVPIKTWKTNNEITYTGPVAGFIDENGLTVRVSGSFFIEGK